MPSPVHIIAVAGMVEDGKGNVLLIKSNHRKIWEFPGGQVESGENLEEALKREVKEESGVNISVRCLVGLYSNIQKTTWYDGITKNPTKLTIDFICDYVSGDLMTSAESSEVIWCPREKAVDMINHPIFKMRMKNLLDFSGEIFYNVYKSQPFKQFSSRFF